MSLINVECARNEISNHKLLWHASRRPQATCWLRFGSRFCPKPLNINLFIMKTLMLQYFSLLFVTNRSHTHCPTRWKIFMDFLLSQGCQHAERRESRPIIIINCSSTNASWFNRLIDLAGWLDGKSIVIVLTRFVKWKVAIKLIGNFLWRSV